MEACEYFGYSQLGSGNSASIGDKMIYYIDKNGDGEYNYGEFVARSAVVNGVGSSEEVSGVVSKWGPNGLYESDPAIPYYTGDQTDQNGDGIKVL